MTTKQTGNPLPLNPQVSWFAKEMQKKLSLNADKGPPILFETMIFGGKHDQDMWRYRTWAETEEGHEVTVNIVKTDE